MDPLTLFMALLIGGIGGAWLNEWCHRHDVEIWQALNADEMED